MTENLPDVQSASAFFFDFDGTLVALAPRPDLVAVEPHVREVLDALAVQFDGAVAYDNGVVIVDHMGWPASVDRNELPVTISHSQICADSPELPRIDEDVPVVGVEISVEPSIHVSMTDDRHFAEGSFEIDTSADMIGVTMRVDQMSDRR